MEGTTGFRKIRSTIDAIFIIYRIKRLEMYNLILLLFTVMNLHLLYATSVNGEA